MLCFFCWKFFSVEIKRMFVFAPERLICFPAFWLMIELEQKNFHFGKKIRMKSTLSCYKSQIHCHWSYIAEGIGASLMCHKYLHILHTLLFAFSSCAMMNLCLDSFDLSWFLFIFFSNVFGMRSATIDDVVLLYFFFILRR